MTRKISSFNKTTTLQSVDTFTLVVNGTNVNITAADLATALGVTGTMSQRGAVTGTPILDKAGVDNGIRNLEAGDGIALSVSPENGATISHNFTQDGIGIPLTFNLDSANPTIASMEAGPGISIFADDTHIQIDATGVVTSQNVVIVNELSDFPAPSGGVITLAPNIYYLISGTVALGANQLVASQNSVIGGSDSSVSNLTYSGSDVMFTSASDSFKITKVTADCPNGTLFDISSTGGGIFQIVNMTIMSCDVIGTIEDMGALQITDVSFEDVKTNGVTFIGTIGAMVGDRNLFMLNGGVAFDLNTSVFQDKFTMDSSLAVLAAGTTFLSGLVSSGNMATGVLGTLLNMSFSGLGAPLNNVSPNDARWQFSLNDNIPDTRPDALLSHQGSLTVIIAAIDTPVKVTGAVNWVSERTSQFTNDVSGTSTYLGEKNAVLAITGNVSGEAVSGTNKDYTFYIAINGAVVTNSGQTTRVSSGDPKNTPVPWQTELVNGDTVEVWVENNSDATNLQVNSAVLRIN